MKTRSLISIYATAGFCTFLSVFVSVDKITFAYYE